MLKKLIAMAKLRNEFTYFPLLRLVHWFFAVFVWDLIETSQRKSPRNPAIISYFFISNFDDNISVIIILKLYHDTDSSVS